MGLNQAWIDKTEGFLKDRFQNSLLFQSDPDAYAYRLEHSYRVANIGKQIAEAEGFDPTEMVIACLLHDISYCEPFRSREESMNHGRLSAKIARPFLKGLGLAEERIEDICYGIAIHVDDTADFPGERTRFAETISDADNIDRFDVYRIYENLNYMDFSHLPLEEKQKKAISMLEQLHKLRMMKLATPTAIKLWQQRIDFYISFYERLNMQLHNSSQIR